MDAIEVLDLIQDNDFLYQINAGMKCLVKLFKTIKVLI